MYAPSSGVPGVEGERRLAVGADRQRPPAPGPRQRPAGEEDRDLLAAAEPGRQRRHREGGVLGEHPDDGLDVAPLPGLDVGVDDLAEAVVAERAQRLLLALLGQPVVDRLARARCSALFTEAVVVSSDLGGLLGGEAEHLAQDQHGALVGRQVLERGDERQLDALALLVAGLGAGEPVLEPEVLVGVGLDPHRLDQRLARAAVRVGGGAVVDRAARAWGAARSVERGVGGDR